MAASQEAPTGIPTGTENWSVPRLAVETLAQIPVERWGTFTPYQEVDGNDQNSVTGFKTELPAFGEILDVSLELVTNPSPYLLHTSSRSPYRIRVVRYENDKPLSVDYGFHIFSPAGEAAEALYKKLDEEIAEPQRQERTLAEIRLRKDFEAALRTKQP